MSAHGRREAGEAMKKEKLYLSSIGLDAPETARAFGLGLELAQFCTAAFLDHCGLRPPEDGFLKSLHESLQQCLRASGRRVLHGPFNELTPAAIDPLVLEITERRYRQAIKKAAELGCEKLVLHAGFVPLVYYPEWFISRSVELWKRLCREIPAGLTVCLENVMEPEPGMLLEIIEGVHCEKLRICLDLGHANTSASSVPPETWLLRCAPYLAHIHLHNNDGARDLHAPVFEGTMDVPALLRQQQALCPQASVTLEVSECRASVLYLEEQGILED